MYWMILQTCALVLFGQMALHLYRRNSRAARVFHHMRRYVVRAAVFHETSPIAIVVGAQGDGHACKPRRIRRNVGRRVEFGADLYYLCVHRQPLPVVACAATLADNFA